MIEPYRPDAEYVERLGTPADEGLAAVTWVWSDGIPVEARDIGGLCHTARHVTYSRISGE